MNAPLDHGDDRPSDTVDVQEQDPDAPSVQATMPTDFERLLAAVQVEDAVSEEGAASLSFQHRPLFSGDRSDSQPLHRGNSDLGASLLGLLTLVASDLREVKQSLASKGAASGGFWAPAIGGASIARPASEVMHQSMARTLRRNVSMATRKRVVQISDTISTTSLLSAGVDKKMLASSGGSDRGGSSTLTAAPENPLAIIVTQEDDADNSAESDDEPVLARSGATIQAPKPPPAPPKPLPATPKEIGDNIIARKSGINRESLIIVFLDVVYIITTCVGGITAVTSIGYQAANRLTDSLTQWHIAVAIVCQLFYFIWIGSRFFVQQRKGEWEVLGLLPDIRSYYLKTWFAFDAAAAIPFDWIFLGWSNDIFIWFQCRLVLRFVRIFSLVESGNPLIGSRKTLGFLAQVTVIIVVIHIASIVFATTQDSEYIEALYWASTTMTSVGYGDVLVGRTSASRVLAIFAEFAGIIMISSLTAFATSLLTSKDALTQISEEKKLLLASMLRYYDIPWDAQLEVISLFPTVLDSQNEDEFKQLIQSLPPFIIDKIQSHVRARTLVAAIPLFSTCELKELHELTRRLSHRFHEANEFIITAGDEGAEMYFLVRGIADVVITTGSGDLVLATLRSGAFFGEVALLASVQRTASIVSVTPCELLVLSKDNFEELGADFPGVHAVFLKVIEEGKQRKAAASKAQTSGR